MPAPRNESPIESIVSNPGRTPVKCAWGTADGSWLNLAPGEVRRFPYDVFTVTEAPGRRNLMNDVAGGRVVLAYITRGVDCVREDQPKPVVKQPVPVPVIKETVSDAAAKAEPLPVPFNKSVEGPGVNKLNADDFDSIGRVGSMESSKPDRVSPMDGETTSPSDAPRIQLDDWDGTLATDQAAVEAAQISPEVPAEYREVAEARHAKAKRGRR